MAMRGAEGRFAQFMRNIRTFAVVGVAVSYFAGLLISEMAMCVSLLFAAFS